MLNAWSSSNLGLEHGAFKFHSLVGREKFSVGSNSEHVYIKCLARASSSEEESTGADCETFLEIIVQLFENIKKVVCGFF